VTGGNKGIGRAICERLLTEWDDTHVILTARDEDRGKQAVDEIRKAMNCPDDRLEFLKMDVASDSSVQEAVEAFSQKYGAAQALYGIINNAGVSV